MNTQDQRRLFEKIFNTTKDIDVYSIVLLPSIDSSKTKTTHQIRVEFKNTKGLAVLNAYIDEILIRDLVVLSHNGNIPKLGEYKGGSLIDRMTDFIYKKVDIGTLGEIAEYCKSI
jgi:hypothetical protein